MGRLGSRFRLASFLKQRFLLLAWLGTVGRSSRLLGKFSQTLFQRSGGPRPIARHHATSSALAAPLLPPHTFELFRRLGLFGWLLHRHKLTAVLVALGPRGRAAELG